jgi:hypothetical protein
MRVRSDGSDFFVDVRILAETTCLGRRALMNDPIVGILEQDDAPIAIDEMWTFCRPIGSLTATHPVDPGHCANCGAPVEHPSIATCPYCGKAQRNAEWLVSAIASNEFCSTEFAQPSSTSQTGAS